MTIFNVCGQRIKEGVSITIYAQGTRQPVFSRKSWGSIGTKLAERSGVPVVPIAVKTDIEPTRPGGKGWFKDFGTVDPSKTIRISCAPGRGAPARPSRRWSPSPAARPALTPSRSRLLKHLCRTARLTVL